MGIILNTLLVVWAGMVILAVLTDYFMGLANKAMTLIDNRARRNRAHQQE